MRHYMLKKGVIVHMSEPKLTEIQQLIWGCAVDAAVSDDIKGDDEKYSKYKANAFKEASAAIEAAIEWIIDVRMINHAGCSANTTYHSKDCQRETKRLEIQRQRLAQWVGGQNAN